MSSKIKTIIILVVIGVILFLSYFLFFKPAPAQPNLTTITPTTNGAISNTSAVVGENISIGADFLSTLLSVKNIKLDDSIFNNGAFSTLRDSSIELIPDQNEGRPNPFAPIGSDILPANTQTNALNTTGVPVISGTVGAPSASGAVDLNANAANSAGSTNDNSGTGAPGISKCILKLSATGLDPLLEATLSKGKSLQITASSFVGLSTEVSWAVDDTSIATISAATGQKRTLKGVKIGATQLTVTDNASACSIVVPVTIN